MIRIDFEGWFECRLATDPDPSDEPRGVSGWTFALAGEPDLDRVIRTRQAGTVARRFGPSLGVRVNAVDVDGQTLSTHSLIKAPVDFLDSPVFEGRNGLASEDTEEPIFPVHLRIAQSGVVLDREFRDPATGDWEFQVSAGIEADSAMLLRSGIGDPASYLEKRIQKLSNALATEKDEQEKLRLEARLRHIEQRQLGPVPPFVGLKYRYVLDGPWVTIEDPSNGLGVRIDATPWLANLWIGCWDGDLLCGFMTGSLTCATTPR